MRRTIRRASIGSRGSSARPVWDTWRWQVERAFRPQARSARSQEESVSACPMCASPAAPGSAGVPSSLRVRCEPSGDSNPYAVLDANVLNFSRQTLGARQCRQRARSAYRLKRGRRLSPSRGPQSRCRLLEWDGLWLSETRLSGVAVGGHRAHVHEGYVGTFKEGSKVRKVALVVRPLTESE